jgi:hypothetical protein
MSIAELALVLTFASFAVLSLAALVLRRFMAAASIDAGDARILFLRAVFPAIVPALIAAAILLPSFLLHEAPRSDEWPGMTLVVLALAGAVRLVIIVARAAIALRASRTLVRSWLKGATALPAEPWGVRASGIDVGFPVVAVAGLFKPHVFVDRRVLEMCSPEELAAVAAHERAHIAAFDNLRRLLVAACDGYRSAAAIAWRAAAERDADDRAATSARSAADLAGALVRLARVAQTPMLPLAAISTIHDAGTLESRVNRLLAHRPSKPKLTRWRCATGVAAAALVLMWSTPLPKALHAGLELMVRHLP